MHLIDTVELLRRKLSAIAQVGIGPARDPLDLDTFLSLGVGQYLFSDPYLRSPPSVKSVETLVRLGVPSWPLVNRGVVNEVFELLRTRRERGLASPRQARLLRDLGHTKPWAVLFIDVPEELRRLKEGREGKN